MEKFTVWSRQFHTLTKNAGLPFTLMQTGELLASGFGHKSRAGFKDLEGHLLEKAAICFLSVDRISARATQLAQEVPDETFRSLVIAMCKTDRRLQMLEQAYFVSHVIFNDSTAQEFSQIAREVGGFRNDLVINKLEPATEIDEDRNCWRWNVDASMHVICPSMDLSVPIKGSILYPKLGAHLFGNGYVSGLKLAADPRPLEVTEDIFMD